MEKQTLTINGMGSQHCVMVVKNIIEKHDGAALENIEIGKATVSIDESRTSLGALVKDIEKMGYKVQP